MPERIGRYRVLREIGHGGMGVVYEAEQDNPKRRVALKVIRDGLASHEMRRRFRRESHLLGQLRHPGIAHVYEAGTERVNGLELPFFAMELVDGDTLGTHLRDADLGMRETLELFARICDAVQHAHQKGVVHRDLKPQNVLISRETTALTGSSSHASLVAADSIGQPKILDFGVARVVDKDTQATLQTHAGQLVGTLSYMSPEQFEGDPSRVDTRCDVFSLGVMLYQALAGRLPVDVSSKPVAEAARLLRDADPRPLGSLDSALRGDVETIVATAMEKDCERRYVSAAALADDIRRHLTNEPIAARPASAVYQIGKFAARNRLLVGSASSFVLLLIAGLVLTSVLLLRVERERQESTEAEARTRVVANFQRDLLRSLRPAEIGERVERTLLKELRTSSSVGRPLSPEKADVSDRIALAVEQVNETNIGRAVLQQIIVERALELIDGQYFDDPRTEAEIRWALFENFMRLGEDRAAGDQIRRVVDLRTRLYGPDADSTVGAKRRLGAALVRLGEYGEAEEVLRRVIAYEDASRGKHSQRGVDARIHLGRALREIGRPSEAAVVLIGALDSARLQSYSAALGDALNELGVLRLEEGRVAEAVVYFEEFLTVASGNRESISRRHLLALNNVMAAKLRDGRLQEAEQYARQIPRLYSREFGDYDHRTMNARNSLARVLLELEESAEAMEILSEEYERSHRLLVPSNAVRQAIATNYVDACLLIDDAEHATAVAQALLMDRRSQDADAGSLAQTLEQLGLCQLALDDYARAEASFRECLAFRESIDSDHWLTHRARSLVGVALIRRGRANDATSLITNGTEGILRHQESIPPNMRAREVEAALARRRLVEPPPVSSSG
ncbi:MAG: serine/threonine-protein kinase [Planctomycetota bacterium]